MTNEQKIAEALDSQSYDDRMEMARWFQIAVVDYMEDQPSGYIITAEDFAIWFSAYADEVREPESN